MAAFMHFGNAARGELLEQAKKDMGDGGGKEGNMKRMAWVGKQIGEKWANLGAEEKAKYEELAKQDKERFAREMAEFEKEHPEELKKHKEDSKAKTKAKRNALKKG